MKARHTARTFEMLAISVAVQLESSLMEVRRARSRGWSETKSALWTTFYAYKVCAWRCSRVLREAHQAARALGVAIEFRAACRRVFHNGRKDGVR